MKRFLKKLVGQSVKRFFPVIHIDTPEQALRQIDIAVQAKADGVWLISHEMDHGLTMSTFRQARELDSRLWIGINLLGLHSHAAMKIVSQDDDEINGLWCDIGGVDDHGVGANAKNAWELKCNSGWEGEYFGSVAFKAGPSVDDPATVAKLATEYMDVVTTSGPATGVAASVDKIRGMKDAMGEHRLAIASGITPENVQDYLPYVDDFLVATGISKDFHRLDLDKVQELSAIIHGVS